jgi:sugar O-acyltransferase (sialic acid O-acetyltransferase NeuD family)
MTRLQLHRNGEITETMRIVILGTGGNSVDILDTVHDFNDASDRLAYDCVGFLDDNEVLWGSLRFGAKVLGPLVAAKDLDDCHFVNGIGAPTNYLKKAAIIAKTGLASDRFVTIVHPTASVSRTATLGRGTVVFQHATITSNVRIGDHVVILPNSVVSHDVVVGDYACIAGGACVSGGVRIGTACYIGTNSSIIGGVELGDGCLVGMGSVVLDDVPAGSVVVGNPARFLRRATGKP